MSWYEHSFVYQIYPLGCCGAPYVNDGVESHRISRLAGWTDHLKRLGVTCVLLNPVFESETHGYDTRDYTKVDCRLGTNEDLAELVSTYHDAGIKVILDGVFNHVGRGFWAFRDVLEKRQSSQYQDWFHISWEGNTGFNDGFWYDAWEGCDNLVRLNLANPAVRGYLLDVVRGWVRDFDIDGLRLDVAYCLDWQMLRDLRGLSNELSVGDKPGFVLVGETLFGDYNQIMNDDMCHSVTNYEAYKGLWSSMNTDNLHEIAYAMGRQSGSHPWDLYTGKHLLDFVDNHDVARIATQLDDARKLAPLYGLLFGMPGVPCVYYGSEWAIEGEKHPYDHEIRPEIERPEWTDLTEWVSKLGKAKTGSAALCDGDYSEILCQPQQLLFQRRVDGLDTDLGYERVIVALNIADSEAHLDFDAGCGQATDLITGELHDFGGGSTLPPLSCAFWLCER